MNSRLIRVLIVVIGIAIGLSAGYLFSRTSTTTSTHSARRQTSLRDAGGGSRRDHRGCARRPVRVRRARSGRGVLDVARREPDARPPEARRRVRRLADRAGRAKRVRGRRPAALENFRTLDAKVREFVQERQRAARGRHDLLGWPRIDGDRVDAGDGGSQRRASIPKCRHGRASQPSARDRSAAARGVILLLMVGLVLLGGASSASRRSPKRQRRCPWWSPSDSKRRCRRRERPSRRSCSPPHSSAASSRASSTAGHLPHLLERAARVLDASGIIVWVAEPSRQAARAGDIPRLRRTVPSRGWAASTATRTTPRRPPIARPKCAPSPGDASTNGAFIVPLMTSDGCVGVLSAEMKAGCEKDESAQALATIFAVAAGDARRDAVRSTRPVPVKIAAQA